MNKLIFITVFAFIITGCANTKYAWHNYNNELYSYYKDATAQEDYINELHEIIVENENNGRVPPGIYAEYGYMMYELNNFGEAIIYFEKEQATWPESRVIMAKMIRNSQVKSGQVSRGEL